MTIEEAMKWIASLAAAAAVSGVVNSIVLYYIRHYIDDKLAEGRKEKSEREKRRREMNIAEQERRHAAGRLLFWLHHSIVKGEHNGELESAMESYQAAEHKQKVLEQEILASIDDSGK